MDDPKEQRIPGLRKTKAGKFELTIYHPSLKKGRACRNFDDEQSAIEYRTRRLAELRKGVILAELARKPTGSTQLSVVIRHYLNADNIDVAESSRETIEQLQETLQGDIAGLTSKWVDAWVTKLKREDKNAPSTIRKKVEALARVIDWWFRREYQTTVAPGNPLRNLPTGYSTYNDRDVTAGEAKKVDVKRNRRLNKGEEDAITAVINGAIIPPNAKVWRAKTDRVDFMVFFKLITNTGMRLREAYRLQWDDVSEDVLTIFIRRSKTDATREIPMSDQVLTLMREYRKHRGTQSETVFPFWSGSEDAKYLKNLSSALSKRFAGLFSYAGISGLTEHDLRHEATIRWMTMKEEDGRWMYRTEEVMRITGHSSEDMLNRYFSIRGSDLAERMHRPSAAV